MLKYNYQQGRQTAGLFLPCLLTKIAGVVSWLEEPVRDVYRGFLEKF